MRTYESQYLEILDKLLHEGELVGDRTGTGNYRLKALTMTVDNSKGLPLITTKYVNINNIIGELLWMLSGSVYLRTLREYQNKPEGSKTIWSDDFDKYYDKREQHFKQFEPHSDRRFERGGKIYGMQWRSYYSSTSYGNPVHHDQIKTLLSNIEAVKQGNLTMARRLIVTAWNPYDHTVGDKIVAALPACHTGFQCWVKDGKLDLLYHCRSNDWFLGQPYNTTFYAVLQRIIAKLTGLQAGDLIYMGTDVHLYTNHTDQAKEQLSRTPYNSPELILPEFDSLEELLKLTAKDFELVGYNHHEKLYGKQSS